MKVLVCVKQVPDMESQFKANAAGLWYDEKDLAWRMNEYDEYAVEQAIRLKEQVGEADITVLSVGPARTGDVLRKALAMGCDRAVQILDDDVWMRDPFQIANAIAKYALDQCYDIIFTGMQSQDRGSAQVGVLLAEMLNMSCATTLVGFEYASGTVVAKRELEGGIKSIVKLRLPALVTCQLGINIPRYPTMPNIMKAKKKEVTTIELTDDLLAKATTETTRMYTPHKKTAGIVLEGDVEDLVSKLTGILRDRRVA